MNKEDKEKQKQYMSKMDSKEKRKYLLDQYKFHMIGIIVTIGIVIYFIITSGASKVVASANISVWGDSVNTNGVVEFVDDLNTELPQYNNETSTIQGQGLSLGEGDDPMIAMANIQKLAAEITSGDVDLVIGEYDSLMKYASGGGYSDWYELLNDEEAKSLNIVEVIYEVTDGNGNAEEEIIFNVIDINSISSIKSMLSGDKIGIVIISNSPNKEAAVEIAKYIAMMD